MMCRQSGQILVVVFWMLGIVSLTVGAVVMRSGHEARLSRIPLEAIQRKAIAEAAVQQAIALLQRDDVEIDHLGEAWATGEEAGVQVLADIPVGNGMFRVGVPREDGGFAAGLIDEGRKLHLNTSAADVLKRLIEAVNIAGVNAQEIADAIINWCTPNDPETGICLGRQPPCHNGPLSSVDELRLVPGMTPELFDALAPYVTVYPLGGAAVNINTAPAIVLDALECAGAQLVAQRQVNDPPIPSGSCGGTTSMSEAFTVPVEAWLTTSSLRTRLHAVIDRDGNILSWLPQS